MIDQLEPFHDAVIRHTEGTPYTVTARNDGFDVGLDIVNAGLFGIYSAQGLKRVFLHRVKVDEKHYPSRRSYLLSVFGQPAHHG